MLHTNRSEVKSTYVSKGTGAAALKYRAGYINSSNAKREDAISVSSDQSWCLLFGVWKPNVLQLIHALVRKHDNDRLVSIGN